MEWVIVASRRELLDSLKPGMHLDKNFFLKVYGHEITRPGFAENVIKRLEILGCSKAREYNQYLTPYPIMHIGIDNFQRTGYSEVERAVLGW